MPAAIVLERSRDDFPEFLFPCTVAGTFAALLSMRRQTRELKGVARTSFRGLKTLFIEGNGDNVTQSGSGLTSAANAVTGRSGDGRIGDVPVVHSSRRLLGKSEDIHVDCMGAFASDLLLLLDNDKVAVEGGVGAAPADSLL